MIFLKRALQIFLWIFIIISTSHITLQAGQVVTQDSRTWAREALLQEKGLSTVISDNTLAVLYFQNKSGKARLNPLQKGLAFMLMTDLSQVEGIQMIERVKLQALVEEMNLGVSGLVDPATAPRVGRLLGARYLVGGDIQGTIAQLGIASDVLEVPGEKVAGSPSSEGELSRVFDMEKEILFAIIDILKIALTPEKKIELEKPITRDIDALLNMIYAIESCDRGNYLKAEAYYNEALRKDPEFGSARDGLEELRRLKLVDPRERSLAMTRSLGDRTSQTSSLTPDYSSLRRRTPADIPSTEGQIRVHW